MSSPSREERLAVRASCTRWFTGGGVTPQSVTAALVAEAALGGDLDQYGEGGVVAEVEEQVRVLLGAEAAVLLPSGTMAQQIALRLHGDERGLRRVAMHPTSHLVLHEEQAAEHLHGLEVVQLEALDDVTGFAAVLVELPRRETGGQLMSFDDLAELSFRCAEAGVALHLDGARLWECGPAYLPRQLSEVAGLADTTYVSLYKALGAPAGAVLTCAADQAELVRTWRHRHGGTLYQLWPLALAARRGLREVLPRLPLHVSAARSLASAVERAGLSVVVQPVTPLLHVVLPGDPDALDAALLEASRRSGLWLGGKPRDGLVPGTSRLELTCTDGSLEIDPDEVAALLVEAVEAVSL